MTIIHTPSLSPIFTATAIAASTRLVQRPSAHITSASFGGGGGRIRRSDGTQEGVSFAPEKRVLHVVHTSPQGARSVPRNTVGVSDFYPDAETARWAKRCERRSVRRALKSELRAELRA